tara:strand:- start:3794 stop:4030 length:237 start_codon:yes stop_codon:yes gene_type:complete
MNYLTDKEIYDFLSQTNKKCFNFAQMRVGSDLWKFVKCYREKGYFQSDHFYNMSVSELGKQFLKQIERELTINKILNE